MSTGARCHFYEKTQGQWFYDLQRWPYGSSPDYDTFGPFPHYKAAVEHLDSTQPNPGGWTTQPLPGCSHDMVVKGYGRWHCQRCGLTLRDTTDG